MNTNQETWLSVCNKSDLVINSGVCALVDNHQVAIFGVQSDDLKIYAISNYDPIGKAHVLYRGIVGSINDEPVVASPLFKQHFSLTSGQCIEDDSSHVRTFKTRLVESDVQILI
ncbi:nitrite reductase small subunit NirD [Aliikangiella marina]|uniref:Nitrite reductase small subunit NirD n=2 Tax=Aliikangiella marina TaxID=1712262 RepID=A0A545TK70_9GAMM|nr:nitrite reductase small subunit NirD [Aliikangiella marina]